MFPYGEMAATVIADPKVDQIYLSRLPRHVNGKPTSSFNG